MSGMTLGYRHMHSHSAANTTEIQGILLLSGGPLVVTQLYRGKKELLGRAAPRNALGQIRYSSRAARARQVRPRRARRRSGAAVKAAGRRPITAGFGPRDVRLKQFRCTRSTYTETYWGVHDRTIMGMEGAKATKIGCH